MDPERDNVLHLRLMESVVEHAAFGVVISEIRPDGLQIVYVNVALTTCLGYTLEDVVGKSPLLFSPEKNHVADLASFDEAMRTGSSKPIELLNYRKDGSAVWVDVSVFMLVNERRVPTHVIGFQRDVTERHATRAVARRVQFAEESNAALAREIGERKRVEEELVRAATHDALTGLPNRTLFVERLRQALARGQRSGRSGVAVLFLDCDRFKLVNDSFGHFTGDMLLVALGHRLENCLRDGDTIARFGGDEFTILLDDAEGENAATRVAQRCLDALAEPFALDGHDAFVTASIGIAVASSRKQSSEDLLRDADIAMYRAKELGKNRYEVFALEMRRVSERRHRLETALRRALARGEIEVAYQPVFSLAGRHLAGFEALMRWRHEELGMVSPAEFVPIAEETGLILPLGDWIMFRACEQMMLWQKQFPAFDSMSISVNVAASQLLEESFVDRVRSVLTETRLRPDLLCLEITESSLMRDPEGATRTLCDLRGLAVKIHMDDFGTGYSSLAYLHQFPVDTLKIDRSFVSDGESADIANLEIVRTVIALAGHLKLDVTAEGVETEAQEAQLRLLRCSHAQGYLFSRPLTALDASAFIAKAYARAPRLRVAASRGSR